MTQPQVQPLSGIPTPVVGVTGGQGLPQGVASVEGSTGNVVITPPSNVVQFRKGDIPQALQVYEYFHSNTDFSRIEMVAQTGGPFLLGVQTAPNTVIRGLDIVASGTLFIDTNNVQVNTSLQINNANLVVTGVPNAGGIIQTVELAAQFALLTGTQPTPVAGVVALGNLTAVANPATTNTLDWVISIGSANYRVRLYQ